MTRRRLLAVTTSPLPVAGQITDGPGFRMWNLLREVAKSHDVHILNLYDSLHRREKPGEIRREAGMVIEPASHGPGRIGQLVRKSHPDVLFLPWSSAGFLGNSNRDIPTILDYVGPGLLETYARLGRIPLPLLHLKLASFSYGDLFVTTTDRERYYLIGLLAASRRLSGAAFARDDPLVRVVRMTPPPEAVEGPPRVRRSASEPLIVLLSGAFLPWYDYDLVANALSLLPAAARANIRVRVIGGNPRMPDVEQKAKAILSTAGGGGMCEFLGLVPFQERVRVYRESDVGLSLPSPSVEDELSSRTRVVDYLWAQLPILSEGRDEYSMEIIASGAGFRFEHSPSSLAGLLNRLQAHPELAVRARQVSDMVVHTSFNVSKEAIPILEFLENPRLTPRRPSTGASLAMAGIWVSDLLGDLRHRMG
jgi:hypothetical protein